MFCVSNAEQSPSVFFRFQAENIHGKRLFKLHFRWSEKPSSLERKKNWLSEYERQ